MNKNEISVTIKAQNGGTWPDAAFNIHQTVGHVLEKAIDHFHLDPHPAGGYEVLLAQNGSQRSLDLAGTLTDDGVHTHDVLLVRTAGRTVDG